MELLNCWKNWIFKYIAQSCICSTCMCIYVYKAYFIFAIFSILEQDVSCGPEAGFRFKGALCLFKLVWKPNDLLSSLQEAIQTA